MEYSTLDTKRFILKVLTPELVSNEYLSWFSAEGASDFILYARNEVTLLGLKKYVQEKLISSNALFFGIFLKEDGTHIGNIKFEPLDFDQKFTILGVLIGNAEWRGRGVFSEVCIEIEKCLKEMGIRKIYLGVGKDNQGAIKAYSKEGFAIYDGNPFNIDLNISICMMKEIV